MTAQTFTDTLSTDRPEVVCICGSTRFRTEMVEANRRLTMAGSVVVAPGVFGHDGDPLTDEDKARLDVLHFRKIDMADRVVVVAPGEYIGESTSRAIAYARETGKPVDVWDDFELLATVQPDRDTITRAIAAVTDLWDEPLDEVHDVPQIVNAVLALLAGQPAVAEVRAQALIDFADATRFPSDWILFRRDDGSGVTVPDLLRETAARERGETR